MLAAALQAASSGARTVQPATLERPSAREEPAAFRSLRHTRGRARRLCRGGMVRQRRRRYSASPYKTQIFLYRPRRPGPVQRHHHRRAVARPGGAADLHVHRSPMSRDRDMAGRASGSQKMPLDTHVKPKDAAYYASLNIEAAAAPPGTPASLPRTGCRCSPPTRPPWPPVRPRWNASTRRPTPSSRKRAPRSDPGKGPFQGYKVRHITAGRPFPDGRGGHQLHPTSARQPPPRRWRLCLRRLFPLGCSACAVRSARRAAHPGRQRRRRVRWQREGSGVLQPPVPPRPTATPRTTATGSTNWPARGTWGRAIRRITIARTGPTYLAARPTA